MQARLLMVLLIAVGFPQAGGNLGAQEKKMPGLDALREVLPNPGAGKPIDDAQRIWAYVAGVVGFILIFALAWFMVRLLALLTIAACFLGSIVLICWAVHERFITTWEQLAVIVIALGAQAGVISVTANLFLITGGIEKSPEQPTKNP